MVNGPALPIRTICIAAFSDQLGGGVIGGGVVRVDSTLL